MPTAHFRADDLGPLDHGPHVADGDIARVIHPAVGGDDDVFGGNVGKCPSDARCYDLRRFDVHVGQVDHAEQVSVMRQSSTAPQWLLVLKNCSCHQVSIETAQSKLDYSVLSELGGKQVLHAAALMPSEGRLQGDMDGSGSRDTIKCAVERRKPVLFSFLRTSQHVWFIDLYDVGSGCE
jgi:hypothetical protein